MGYREMKQHLLANKFTLRSKKGDMVKQELWGILLCYNLIRYQIGEDGQNLARYLSK